VGDSERLRRALAAIDAANAEDPHQLRMRGALRPKELAHAELASEWVERLCPDASEALRLAARAHHLQRWRIPRSEYPEGRPGYLAWRRALQRLHAELAGEILAEAGYAQATRDRVAALIQKRGLARDPEVQVLEDALCLVFLETQLASLAERLEEPKLVEVLRKTLRKMSAPGIQAARGLSLEPELEALLERATAG